MADSKAIKPFGPEDGAYYKWITSEARKIGSDGCTKASEWNQECCYEHDLACSTGRDPHDAYRLFCAGGENVWEYAVKLSRRQADKRFKSCNMDRSGPLGDIRSIIRFIGVRIGAWLP